MGEEGAVWSAEDEADLVIAIGFDRGDRREDRGGGGGGGGVLDPVEAVDDIGAGQLLTVMEDGVFDQGEFPLGVAHRVPG